MRRREGTLDNTRTYRAEHEACGLDHLTLNGSITVPSGEFLDFLRPHFILKKKKKKDRANTTPLSSMYIKLNTIIRHVTLLGFK